MDNKYLNGLLRGEYEFADFGCGIGQSLEQSKQLFGSDKGIGLDKSAQKISGALERGYHAIDYDILALPDEKLVDFVTLVHFLEHVDGYAHAKSFISKAVAIARRFVFIRQPYFDADGYLGLNGLKLYWSDWHGHTYTTSTLQWYRVLRDLSNNGQDFRFKIGLYRNIADSSHEAILPLETPVDQFQYDEEKHGGKADIQFEFPVYQEVRVLIDCRSNPDPLTAPKAYMGERIAFSM